MIRPAVEDLAGALAAADRLCPHAFWVDEATPYATPAAGGNGTRPATPAGRVTAAAPVMRRLSDVEPEPVRWLWPGRIPAGKLTLMAGDPGLGKSLVSQTVAAIVTRGAAWPDGAAGGEPGGVVILSAEDDVADTIRPRIDAAGGDPSRVIVLEAICWSDGEREGERSIDLGADLEAVEAAIEAAGRDVPCRLVIVDPISGYCGAKDGNSNTDIRGMLAPLVRLAAVRGVAVLAVTHLRKSPGAAVYRAMGSLAFAAAARAVWGVTRDADDPTRERILLLAVKQNLSAAPTGMAYRVTGGPGGAPVIAWEPDPVTVDADAVMSGEPRRRRGGAGEAVEEAEEFLRDTLAGGPRTVREIEAEARDAGIAPRTLRRAREALDIRPRKSGMGGAWLLDPPARPEDGQGPQDVGHAWPPSADAQKPADSSPNSEGGQVWPGCREDGHLRRRGRRPAGLADAPWAVGEVAP